MKIFDISDKRAPRYIKSVATACGSHTHTLVPDKRGKVVYLYVSSYGPSDLGHGRLPRHHRVPGEGPRGRRLHG